MLSLDDRALHLGASAGGDLAMLTANKPLMTAEELADEFAEEPEREADQEEDGDDDR